MGDVRSQWEPVGDDLDEDKESIMNAETETTDQVKQGPQTIRLTLGETIDISGLRAKLTYVNPGKRRLTFTLVDEHISLAEPNRNPIAGAVSLNEVRR